MNGFPNWREATEYPNENSYQELDALQDDPQYTSKAWAWEFLRRNAQYQADFDRHKHGSSHDRLEAAKRYGLSFLFPYTAAISAHLPPAVQTKEDAETSPVALPFLNTFSLWCIDRDLRKGIAPNLEEFQTSIVFDVRLPLEKQLALAKLQIEEKTASYLRDDIVIPGRKRTKVYPRYLRMLDARASGVTIEEIVSQFFLERIYLPDEINGSTRRPEADRDMQRALELCHRRYLRIAYS